MAARFETAYARAVKRRARRPNLTRPLRALVVEIAQRMPELAHLRPSRILVVAGEARRSSRASVRPMHYSGTRSRLDVRGRRKKPLVRIRGRKILYVITLRPMWFRASTPEERVATLVHELFHISTRFDGTLHPGRRHARMGRRFGRKLRPLVHRYLARCSPEVFAPFAHHGEVLVRQWLERPPASYPARGAKRSLRRVYTEEQLFLGAVRMINRPPGKAPGM